MEQSELTSKHKLKIEFQSAGYYDYTCLKDGKCYFCELMNSAQTVKDETAKSNDWTPTQVKYLIENYASQTVAETCNYLNRTRGSVFRKVYNLRLSIKIGIPKKKSRTKKGTQVRKPRKKVFYRTDYY